MNSLVDNLCSTILRPFRQEYSEQDLGPRIFMVKDFKVKRHLVELKNSKDQIIKSSFYQIDENSARKSRTIIVYAHSSNGSRIEGKEITKLSLGEGYNVFTFDFSGCGLSDGDFISYGIKESEEIGVVIRYLKMVSKNSKIVLWGRSMGAVASLLYCATDHCISALILDSPFKNLKEVFQYKAKNLCGVPDILVNCSLNLLDYMLEKRKCFNLESIKLDPILSHLTTPALFAASKEDTLVPFHQVSEMYGKYKGIKRFKILKGDHNEERDQSFFKEVFLFLHILELEGFKESQTY